MYSFLFKIAIEVNKAEQLAIGIPIIGLIIEKVLDVIADADPIRIPVISRSFFFLLKLLHFFLYYSLSILSDFNIIS